MNRADLGSKDIISGLKITRHPSLPNAAVFNQLVRGPFPLGCAVAVHQAKFLDLEPLEIVRVDIEAGTVTVGHVIDDETLVIGGPRVPMKLDLGTGGDGHVLGGGNGTLAAVYVARSKISSVRKLANANSGPVHSTWMGPLGTGPGRLRRDGAEAGIAMTTESVSASHLFNIPDVKGLRGAANLEGFDETMSSHVRDDQKASQEGYVHSDGHGSLGNPLNEEE